MYEEVINLTKTLEKFEQQIEKFRATLDERFVITVHAKYEEVLQYPRTSPLRV